MQQCRIDEYLWLRCYQIVEAAAAIGSWRPCLTYNFFKCQHEMLAHVHTGYQKVGPDKV